MKKLVCENKSSENVPFSWLQTGWENKTSSLTTPGRVFEKINRVEQTPEHQTLALNCIIRKKIL